MPCDARPTHLSSFHLLVMASPHLDARRNLLISQHPSSIASGADSRSIESKCSASTALEGVFTEVFPEEKSSDRWCPSIAWMKGLGSVVGRLLLKPIAKV